MATLPTKTCTRCRRILPRDAKHFVRASASKDGLHSWCRDCKHPTGRRLGTRPTDEQIIGAVRRHLSVGEAERALGVPRSHIWNRRKRSEHLDEAIRDALRKPPAVRRCTKCGTEKPLDGAHFYKSAKLRWGFQTACKACKRKAQLDYQRRNRDKINVAHKQWRAANPDKIAAWKSVKPYHELTEAQRERRRSRARERAAARPHIVRRKAAQRRARYAGAAGSYSDADVEAKFELQGGRCYYCRKRVSTYDVDHKKPLARGGSNHPANICVACTRCNRTKKDKPFWDFIGGPTWKPPFGTDAASSTKKHEAQTGRYGSS